MEQQQFRVTLSVGTKLLIGVVALLFIVISFLDLSTVVLLTEDKRAYTFQGQAAEATLVGRDFLGFVRLSQNTLRVALVSSQVSTQGDSSALQKVVEGQTDLISIRMYKDLANTASQDPVNPGLTPPVTTSPSFQPWASAELATEMARLKLGAEDFELVEPGLKSGYADLVQNQSLLMNLSRPGRPPLLGLAIRDAATQQVAVGVFPLVSYASDFYSSKLTLATKKGDVLFDSDPAVLYGNISLKADPLFVDAVQSRPTLGAKEFEIDGTRYLGSYFRPGMDLVVLTRMEWRQAMRATYSLAEKFILLGLMAIGAAILFAILFSKTLTSPLSKLYQATREVAQGNFKIELNSKRKDELGALSNSFVAMSGKIEELIQETVRNAHLENELAIASTVQQTLFPATSHKTNRYEIQSHYQSATECGGDWWGHFEVGNKLAIMIADATGHGLPSALITAAARSCFSVMQKLATDAKGFNMSPSMMLSFANRSVYDSARGAIMMTFFVATIDFDTKKITWASAGHNPPWLFKKSGGMSSLTADGMRLGEAQEVPAYEEKSMDYSPGDILFLYTDGVVEGKNKEDVQYGKKKARKILEAAAAKGPGAMIQDLIQDFLVHNGDKPLDDDVTLASVRLDG